MKNLNRVDGQPLQGEHEPACAVSRTSTARASAAAAVSCAACAPATASAGGSKAPVGIATSCSRLQMRGWEHESCGRQDLIYDRIRRRHSALPRHAACKCLQTSNGDGG